MATKEAEHWVARYAEREYHFATREEAGALESISTLVIDVGPQGIRDAEVAARVDQALRAAQQKGVHTVAIGMLASRLEAYRGSMQ